MHNLLDSSKSILVGEKFEEMHSQRTAYDNSFGFGEPLAEYNQELLIAEGRIRKSVKDNATPKEKLQGQGCLRSVGSVSHRARYLGILGSGGWNPNPQPSTLIPEYKII